MRELTFEQIDLVSGGNRAEIVSASAVTGAGSGGVGGWTVARAAGHGAMRGAVFGLAGAVGGAILFGGIAFIAYTIAE
jgi:hypothetical protein